MIGRSLPGANTVRSCTVSELREDVLVSADVERRRSIEQGTKGIDRHRVRRRSAYGASDDDLLSAGGDVGWNLHIDLARTHVGDEGRLTADGDRGSGQRGGRIHAVEVALSPAPRRIGKVLPVDLDPRTGGGLGGGYRGADT